MATNAFHTNIVVASSENALFRRVICTGARSQLVLMSIPPGDDVGAEAHAHVEQTLFFLRGTCRATLDGRSLDVGPGDVVVVPPGVHHNFVNTGTEPLQIYTVYAPPNHIDGRVHETHAAANADTEDEAFGESVK